MCVRARARGVRKHSVLSALSANPPAHACVDRSVRPTSSRRKSRGRHDRRDGRAPDGRFTVESWRVYCRGQGGRARAARHPRWRLRLWAQRAARIRWNRERARRGLPPLTVPELPPVDTPRAELMRRRRALGRRRAAYDGIPYDDRMASDPAVRRALERRPPEPEGPVVDVAEHRLGRRRVADDGVPTDELRRRPETVISIQTGNTTLAGDDGDRLA